MNNGSGPCENEIIRQNRRILVFKKTGVPASLSKLNRSSGGHAMGLII